MYNPALIGLKIVPMPPNQAMQFAPAMPDRRTPAADRSVKLPFQQFFTLTYRKWYIYYL